MTKINKEELISKAKEGRLNAYVPYSKFLVGASCLMKDGNIITGCNVENASYGLSMCAERTTLFKMITLGYTKDDCVAFAVVGDTEGPISPCGACRQVMDELLNEDCVVYLSNLKGDIKEYTVKELLPYSFKELK